MHERKFEQGRVEKEGITKLKIVANYWSLMELEMH
jgi:hypothetical protein